MNARQAGAKQDVDDGKELKNIVNLRLLSKDGQDYVVSRNRRVYYRGQDFNQAWARWYRKA